MQSKLFDISLYVLLWSVEVDDFRFQVCRNINRIKVCMETGNTVILLNLENLYESLYDALNQVCIGIVVYREQNCVFKSIYTADPVDLHYK